MKYIVVFNRKYLVEVEANSACSAEHKLLDNYFFGEQTAQAFAFEDLGTETFKYYFENCRFVPSKDLDEMEEEYERMTNAIKQNEKTMEEARKKIEELQKVISACKDLNEDSEKALKKLW